MTNNPFEELTLALREFARERDWEKFHTPKNLAMSVMIEAAEIAEHFQWSDGSVAHEIPEKIRSEVAMEIGDTLLYLLRLADRLGIDPEFHQKLDVHIHVPEGATPKDGPSAGIAMCTALVSVLTKVPVRSEVAMTGEITLRGRVLPIGGLKEKLLAAHRGGITTVIIPEDNKKDLADMPANITSSLEIHPVRWIDEVLDIALERPLQPNLAKEAAPAAVAGEPTEGHSLTH